MFLPVNYIAVLVAAIAAMVVGYLWYADFLFGKSWRKFAGGAMDKEGMGKSMSIMFVGSLLTSYVLAYFIQAVNALTLTEGLGVALWVWVGFVVTTTLGDTLFAKKPWNIYWVQNFHQLISFLVMSAILVLWA